MQGCYNCERRGVGAGGRCTFEIALLIRFKAYPFHFSSPPEISSWVIHYVYWFQHGVQCIMRVQRDNRQ